MTSSAPMIEGWLREILRCPSCKGELVDASGPEFPELHCSRCRLGYRIDDGVPVLLEELARPLDD